MFQNISETRSESAYSMIPSTTALLIVQIEWLHICSRRNTAINYGQQSASLSHLHVRLSQAMMYLIVMGLFDVITHTILSQNSGGCFWSVIDTIHGLKELDHCMVIVFRMTLQSHCLIQ